MKLIRYLMLSFFILVSGMLYCQQTKKKATELKTDQVPTKTNIKTAQKNNNIKTVPKAKLKQSQLKKMNQNKSKLQSQKLKKAIRRSRIRRKPFRK